MGAFSLRSWLFGESSRVVILSTFLLFLVITPFVVLKSARDALVLTQFSGSTLPYFMVITTLLVGLLTGVQLRLHERLAVSTVLTVGLLFYAAGTFALDLAVSFGWSLAVPVLYVWANLFGAQIPMLVSCKACPLRPGCICSTFSKQVTRYRTGPRHLCCCNTATGKYRLFTFLQNPDPSVQVAACSCSLLKEQEESREVALRKLEEILDGAYNPDRPDWRLEIAHVLEDFAGFDASLGLARRLLQDPAIEVRRAAIKSVSKSRPDSLLPVLFSSIKDPALWADLRTALAEFGSRLIPHVRRLLPLGDTPLELKKLLLQVISDIGDDECLGLLVQYAEDQNLTLRFQAIKGLNRSNRRQGMNGFRPRIKQLLEKEVQELQENGQQMAVFSSHPSTLIGSLLAQRRRWAQERVFRLLGLMYDQNAVQKAYFAFSDGSSHLFDTALELLDSVLDLEHKRSIIPLLENQAAETDDESSPLTRKETVLQFIKQKDQLAAAAALADLEPDELGQWRRDLEGAAASWREQSLVAETLQWRCRLMQTEARGSQEPDSLTTIEKLESLSKVSIFSRLGPHELLLLASSSAVQDYPSDEIIYRGGETAHHIYNLIKGKVELRREPDQVEEILPGGSFGALAVLSGQPRFFTAQVIEPARCIKVEKETLWEMVEDYPSAARAIFEVLSGQILTMMGRLSNQKDEGQEKDEG